MTESTKHYTER